MQPPPLVLVRRSRRQWYCYNQTSAAATAIGFNKAAASAVAFNQSLTGGGGGTGMTRASRHFLFDFTQKPIKHHHHRVKSFVRGVCPQWCRDRPWHSLLWKMLVEADFLSF